MKPLRVPIETQWMGLDVHVDPGTVAIFSDHPCCEYLAYTAMSETRTWAGTVCFVSSASFMQCNTVLHCERHICDLCW